MSKRRLFEMALSVSVFLLIFLETAAAAGGCATTDCHEGILSIVPDDLPMMQMIRNNAWRHGDADGCVICHGGNPKARKKQKAHRGIPASLKKTLGPKAFYPDPGALSIAGNTCGACHVGYVRRLEKSLMHTEAGKIAGNLSTWGVAGDLAYEVRYANKEIRDADGAQVNGAAPAYEDYIKDLIRRFPEKFPEALKPLPLPGESGIKADPALAALVYQRKECQRCHVGVKGIQRRGDYRGMGCSACHMPYSNEGLYEGQDKSINPAEPGHIFKHRIAGNRKTGGIPVETCNSCHNRGKRIGVSYQGFMETPFGSPFNEKGEVQPKLHGKYYRYVSEDLHHRTASSPEGKPAGGLLCQDCHTSFDVHGDGNIQGTTLAMVEIECADCHGTPQAFPWELPLGFGDEFGRDLTGNPPRGISKDRMMTDRQFGYTYDAKDGFLLSSRGNPLGNVVRVGHRVILHSATGNDFQVPQLKNLQNDNAWKSPAAPVAMSAVRSHLNTLECYGCHASWAAQCYGCHVAVDFSKDIEKSKTADVDWVASAEASGSSGHTMESDPESRPVQLKGRITESLSYTRWETPVLGYNGEGRVSPLMPGCQVVYTVIDGKKGTLVHNRIAENPAEAVAAGQDQIPFSLDMAPVQPHTAQGKARTCESCHLSPKTAGLGISGGQFGNGGDQDIRVDLKDAADGRIIPKNSRVQIPGINRLDFDWSRIIDENGVQKVTVGSHWPLSRAFNREEMEGFLRTGTCLGCHQHMARKEVWAKISTQGRLTRQAHQKLMETMVERLTRK